MAVLRIGSTGTEVEKAQEQLKALGFDPGTIDGIFGANTETAVIAFQQAKGISPDGEIGPITGGHLQPGGI
ncbi:MAG: peptidoglycan-binding domain-containing protein [Potamolinea sp.]